MIWDFFRTRSWQAHRWFFRLILIVLLMASASIGAEAIHLVNKMALPPRQASIAFIDNIRIPPDADSVEFSPRSSLNVAAPGADLEEPGYNPGGRVQHYCFNRLPPAVKVQLINRGNIASAGLEGIWKGPGSMLNSLAVYAGGKADGRMKS